MKKVTVWEGNIVQFNEGHLIFHRIGIHQFKLFRHGCFNRWSDVVYHVNQVVYYNPEDPDSNVYTELPKEESVKKTLIN